jgi:fumarylpyruvate hydrolase
MIHRLDGLGKPLQKQIMKTVIPLPPPVLVPVRGTGQMFPVRRIYCIGRNYHDHVVEMGNDPKKDPPIFFMKPADAIVLDGRFPYPPQSSDVHHEIELVVALGKNGEVFGNAVGLDMTLRDLQNISKKNGRPWEQAKSFDYSAPVGEIVPSPALMRGAITLDVSGERRQSGDISELIWSVPEILAELSKHAELKPGDLIFTGTPAGVAAVKRGDVMTGAIEGLGSLSVTVV